MAVIEGLDHLIGHCTDSHAAMKVVLPRLQMMLHDRSARVRRVFVRLLVGIRDIKTIAVADVVPVSHLHARLVADADIDNISSLLVRLLLPTVSLIVLFMRQATLINCVMQHVFLTHYCFVLSLSLSLYLYLIYLSYSIIHSLLGVQCNSSGRRRYCCLHLPQL